LVGCCINVQYGGGASSLVMWFLGPVFTQKTESTFLFFSSKNNDKLLLFLDKQHMKLSIKNDECRYRDPDGLEFQLTLANDTQPYSKISDEKGLHHISGTLFDILLILC
jgi:hypothetical protein